MTTTENNLKLMTLMLETGINPDVIGALLEISGFAPNHIRYLCGPIVLWGNDWTETLPAWMPAAVRADRLTQINREHTENRVGHFATPIEVVAYLYPLTLAAPLKRTWSHVYLWSIRQSLPNHRYIDPHALTALFDDCHCPDALDEYEEKEHLLCLQRQIRTSVVEEARRRGVAAKHGRTETVPPVTIHDNLLEFEAEEAPC